MRSKLVALLVGMIFMAIGPGPRVKVAAQSQLQTANLSGKTIYFAEANEEASPFDRSAQGASHFAGLLSRAGAEIRSLDWRYKLPATADLIVIAGPYGLAPDQVARLWTYLNDGGSLLLLVDPIPNLRRWALASTSGLFTLTWSDLGLRGLNDVVVTEGEKRQVEQSGDDGKTTTIEVTDLISTLVTSATNTNHPITAGLTGELAFFGARSLEIDAGNSGAVPLVFSPDTFYGEANYYDDYLDNNFVEYNIGVDTGRGALPLIGAVENPATGARLILIGDRDFVTNGGGFQTSPSYSEAFVFPANVNFLLRATSWLLAATPAPDLTFATPAPTATATQTPTPTPMSSATPAATAEAGN